MSAAGSTRLAPEISEHSLANGSLSYASRGQFGVRHNASAHRWLWSGILLLTVAGFIGVAPALVKLWEIWTTDPLRSVGIVILPTSIALLLRAWWRNGWELNGTWWGLPVVLLAFVPTLFSQHFVFFWSTGTFKVNFLPSALPIFLYACGVMLLFAGVRVCLQAWFPLALLLLLQPVPQAVTQYLDLPMQGLSAHIARSFAGLLGLSPANAELLRLMFTPSFGMFIAPGCDGMRGAITMAYCALIAGYLKRVSISKWVMYVVGAFLLGHIFNLLRLCALVAYYKVALGHAALEHFARQADYMIGGLLFLGAAFLFLWVITRQPDAVEADPGPLPQREVSADWRSTCSRTAGLTLLVVAAIVPGIRATESDPESLALALNRGDITVHELDSRIPPRFGDYSLARAWQEQVDGSPALEAAAYAGPAKNDVEVGIWLLPKNQSIEASLLTHGEMPTMKAIKEISTSAGQSVPFNTAFYNDGVTDTLIGDTYCSPLSCWASMENAEGVHFAISKVMDHSTRGKRLVPIFFKVQVPRTAESDPVVYSHLLTQCEDFLDHVDFTQLSQRFQ